jgi:hypothetical protein
MSNIKNNQIENPEPNPYVDLEYWEIERDFIEKVCDIVGSLNYKQVENQFYAWASYKYGRVDICGVTDMAITVLRELYPEVYEDMFEQWKKDNLFVFDGEYYDKESIELMKKNLTEPLDFTGAGGGDR